MLEKESWISIEYLTTRLSTTKKFQDEKGNFFKALKIPGLIDSTGYIWINASFTKLSYNKKYSYLTIFKNSEKKIFDKDGKILCIKNYKQLLPYFLRMEKEAQADKLKMKNILEHNKNFKGKKE